MVDEALQQLVFVLWLRGEVDGTGDARGRGRLKLRERGRLAGPEVRISVRAFVHETTSVFAGREIDDYEMRGGAPTSRSH